MSSLRDTAWPLLAALFQWGLIARRMLLIVSPFLAIIAVLVWLAIMSIDILAAGRAYVEGESLWSKSQKEAVFHLLRFAVTTSESDFQKYQEAMQVPLGFRKARLELEASDRNSSVLFAALLQGGTHPDDIPSVISLYDRFHNVAYMKKVLDIWRTGDQFLARLQAAADDLHSYSSSSHLTVRALDRALNRIIQINEELTPWQMRFSNTLGEATRWLQTILLLVVMVTAGTLVPIGILVTQRMVNRVDRAERDLENIMETVPDVILQVDRQRRLIRWNTPLEQMTGFSSSELRNRLAMALFADFDRPVITNAFESAFVTGYSEVEAKLQPKDRTPIPYHWAAAAVRDSQGNVIDLTVVGRNLTERKHLDQQLRQAQKMEAIGQLAGGIAHDFNNLLTVINGYSQLLLDELDPTDPRRPQLMELRQAGGRAASLTYQLLTFSRKQVVSPTILDINTVLSGMIQMLGRLLGEDINLQMQADPALWDIKADAGQIEQVIMNLAVNARDAMPRGGQLTIETRNIEVDEVLAKLHSDLQPGAYALLAVSDTGHGMDLATQGRIFEPFFTTKDQGKGTGLGLSTVYGIVKQSGGSIEVNSAVGHGTTIKVYFPRTTEAVEPVQIKPVNGRSVGGSETILLVEDEQQVRTFAATTLRPKGYTVLEASNGEEALDLMRRHGGHLHMLVTDIVMPGISGKELAQRLKRICPKIKVLLVSGYPDRSMTGQGIEAEGIHFLQKPYTAETLACKVREALDDHGRRHLVRTTGKIQVRK